MRASYLINYDIADDKRLRLVFRTMTAADFIRSGDAVALTPGGRKSFYHAYKLRMDALVTHPIFDYRVSYRLLEVQARLLVRVLEGEIGDYPVFITLSSMGSNNLRRRRTQDTPETRASGGAARRELCRSLKTE